MSNETSTCSDPYKVLGLPKDATESAIRGSYKKLMLQCHPDKVHDESLREEKAKMFEEVQQAYELLSDPRKRKKYDMEASGQRPSPPSGYKHPAYEHSRTRSKSFEEQKAESEAHAEMKRRERERRMREHEMRTKEEQEAARRREYERRSREPPRYAHTATGNGYSHSPPKEHPSVAKDIPKSGNAAYDEQLEEAEEKRQEAKMKRGDVPVPEYVPGKLNLPQAAPIGPGAPVAAPEPYEMYGRPVHPAMSREHYPMSREHERAERARRSEDMRPHREPHRESTKSRERMQQEAAERLREEREMAEKLGKSVPEPRPRRSSAQKEGRPHISTEDLGEKRERRRGTEGALPVDIPPPLYRTENPPLRTSVSPPDGIPRGGARYGSAPAPPSVSGGPAPKPYGSPQRRHSVSNPPPATSDARERVYTQEPATYGDSGYSSPIHPHGYHKEHKDEDRDDVSQVGPLPDLRPGGFRRGHGNYSVYMSQAERSPVSPGGYGPGPSPITPHTPHVPMHPSALNPGYSPAGYSPSTAGPRYGHAMPQVRRSSTVPSPGSTVGGDVPSSKAAYGRPIKNSDTRSQAGSRYGGDSYGERTTSQREASVRRSSAYGPGPESPLRNRDYMSHMHGGQPVPVLSRSTTMPTSTRVDY